MIRGDCSRQVTNGKTRSSGCLSGLPLIVMTAFLTPVGSLGAAQRFSFTALFEKAGALVDCSTWLRQHLRISHLTERQSRG